MANPPVCRIMDYGKFRYEETQKAKESRKKTIHISIKEVKFRPKIGQGDFDTKVRHIIDFLDDGHKVKVTLQFRGREMAHPELGAKILEPGGRTDATENGKIEAHARLDGRNMTMVLAPDKKPPPKKQTTGRPAPTPTVARRRPSRDGAAPADDSPVRPVTQRSPDHQPDPTRRFQTRPCPR